jgi:hypothetical protein
LIREEVQSSAARRTLSASARLLGALKLDGALLVGLGLVVTYALIVQFSASGQDLRLFSGRCSGWDSASS